MPDNKEELPLPVDKLPECWNDKARMNALYAPFRSRSVNPHDWDSKLIFWKNFIAKWCVHHKRSTFSLPEITKAFQCEGRAPACLEIVVNEMFNNGNLQTVSRFMQTPQETWAGWAMDLLVKKPLIWSFNKVKESVVSPTTENTVYVNIDAIKTQADDILSLVNESCCNKVFSFEEFVNVLDLKDWEKGNLNFVLHYLRCRGHVSLKENVEIESGNEKKNLTLIKISSANEKLSPLNDSDIAMYTLEQNEKYIMKNLEQLECEKEACIKEAKECLAKGMRLAAKSCLRKKHAIETTINSRVATLDNVRVLTGRVRDAETDARVLDAYRRGAAALKSTLTDAGLNEDTAAEAVTDVQDMLDIHKDIQSGLSLKLDESTDSDLEEELADLLASDEVPPSGGTPTASPRKQAAVKTPQDQHEDIERRLKALHMNLPDVPKSPPSMPGIIKQVEEF